MFLKSKTRLLRTAEKFALQGRFEQAIAQYLKVLHETPNDPNTLSVIGDLYTRLGQSKEAVLYYTRVAEHYRNFNYLPKAIAIYRKIIQIEPSNFDLALMLANLCDEEGQKSDALRQYQDLAQKYQKAGDLDHATCMLQKCIRLDPHNPYSLAQMGKILYDLGKKENAENYLLDAADIFLQRGHKRQAHPLFFQILNYNCSHANAILGLIQSSTTSQELSEAQEVLSKALCSNKIKDDHFLKNTLKEAWGFAALQAEKFEEAHEAFQFLSQKNEDLYAKDMLIFLDKLIEKKKPDFAISGFKEALPALIRRQLTAPGLRLIQELDSQYPDHPDIKVLMAGFYHAEGQKVNSYLLYQQALELYLAKRQKSAALTTVESLLSLDPLTSEYWNLHEHLFREVFPDKPYHPPQIGLSSREETRIDNESLGMAPKEIQKNEPESQLTSVLFPTPTGTRQTERRSKDLSSPPISRQRTDAGFPKEPKEDFSSFLIQVQEDISPPESSPFADLFSSPLPEPEQGEILPPFPVKESQAPENSSLFSTFLREVDSHIENFDDHGFTLEIVDDQELPPALGNPMEIGFSAPAPGNGSSPPSPAFQTMTLSASPPPENISNPDSVGMENPAEGLSEEDIFQTVDDFFAGLSNPTIMDLKVIDEIYAKGLAYKEIGMYSNAAEAFLQLLQLLQEDRTDPKYLDCCTSLSFCAMKSGDLQQSIYYLRKALEIPHLEKGRFLALQHELDAACQAAGITGPTDAGSEWMSPNKAKIDEVGQQPFVEQGKHP